MKPTTISANARRDARAFSSQSCRPLVQRPRFPRASCWSFDQLDIRQRSLRKLCRDSAFVGQWCAVPLLISHQFAGTPSVLQDTFAAALRISVRRGMPAAMLLRRVTVRKSPRFANQSHGAPGGVHPCPTSTIHSVSVYVSIALATLSSLPSSSGPAGAPDGRAVRSAAVRRMLSRRGAPAAYRRVRLRRGHSRWHRLHRDTGGAANRACRRLQSNSHWLGAHRHAYCSRCRIRESVWSRHHVSDGLVVITSAGLCMSSSATTVYRPPFEAHATGCP